MTTQIRINSDVSTTEYISQQIIIVILDLIIPRLLLSSIIQEDAAY